jgi:hypothetical protein
MMSTLPTMTTEQAYEIVKSFLGAYWERGGKTDDQIANLLGGMGPDGFGVNSDMWPDWLDAVGSVTGFRLPEL